MHKTLWKLVISILFVLGIPITVPAQKLGKLPTDPSIRTGVLPNGVRYYLVKDAAATGTADFALAFKGLRFKEDPLSALPHFRDARRFLAERGVDPRPGGYARQNADAAILRFERVPLSLDAVTLDSTLLLISDLSARYDGAQQALVISGDINAGALLKKLQIFSLFVPKRSDGPRSAPYRFRKTDQIAYERIPARGGGVTLSAVYRMARTPEEYVGTVQTTVTLMFSSQLGMMLKNRLESELFRRAIPATGLRYRYTPSSRTASDEKLEISLTTDPAYLEEATRVLGSVLADIDLGGASPAEYRDTRRELLMRSTLRSSSSLFYRGGQTDRCLDAFLYGAPLASASAIRDFFFARNLPEQTELRLFNDFAHAVLSDGERLTLRSSSATARGEILTGLFRAAWEGTRDTLRRSFSVNQADTLGFARTDGRIKLRSEKTDPVSGGVLWTFSSGLKVVYRKMETGGVDYYALAVRGGFASIEGLAPGEGAYVGDLLSCYDVAGFKSRDFRRMLRTHGITMDAKVSPSDLRLSGAAPGSRLPLLLKSLAALFQDSRPDSLAIDLQKKVWTLESTARSRNAILDSLAAPDLELTSYKRLPSCSPGFEAKADAYFRSQFSRLNDGVFVIVGDSSPEAVKRILCQYLGSFPTQAVIPPRKTGPSHSATGAVTFMEEGAQQHLDIRLAAPLQLSAEHFLAAAIVSDVLHDRLVKALQGSGMTVEMDWDFLAWPREELSYTLHIQPCGNAGKVYGENAEDILGVLARVREVIGGLGAEPVSEAALAALRTRLASDIDKRKATPEVCIQMVLARYTDGKDLLSRHRDRMKLVTAEKVRDVIRAVSEGSNVESIVR